ncbi:MAG: hypothetical protein V3U47_02070 [Acidimicrobiia bacterium]
MRIPLPALALLVVAASCTGASSSSSSSSSSDVSLPPTSVELPIADTTTTAPPTTSTPPSTPATTVPITVVPVEAAVCDGYLDYLAAFDRDHEVDALRRLDIALGFPRSTNTSRALAALRGRLPASTVSVAEARATLENDYGPGCGEPGPGHAGRYDRLFTEGVIVSGPEGVRLLSGTELIREDPAGAYVDTYSSREGGLVALEQIGGLEIIEYREGTEDVPRDLVLDVDLRLHGTVPGDGVEYAIVTTWEAGAFGEETQFLDLFPVKGGDPTRVGVVGTATAAAETVSYADGYFLVTESFVGGSTIYALGLDGERREVPGLPLLGEGASGVSALPLQRARVAPGGNTFAYLRVTPGVGAGGVDVVETELVVQRLDDGVEELSIKIGGRDEIFVSLDFDGHWAIAARMGTLVVIDTWGPQLVELSVANVGSARFLDNGLLVGP